MIGEKMAIAKITDQEKKKLREKAKKKIEQLKQILNNEDTAILLNDFKNKFNICETAYKVILAKYQQSTGKRKNNKIIFNQVCPALRFAGYNFDEELLKNLFGSKSEKGKTVKKLRDDVTHGIDQKAVNEISARRKELFTYMDTFLDVIESFDDTTA